MFGVPVATHLLPTSPLVGEDQGGGRPASAGQEIYSLAEQPAEAVHSAPPPYPPHKGEGLERLGLAPDTVDRARGHRRIMTDAERNLWRALKAALPQHHWRKQVPMGRYFTDFASHSARLVIEVDGGQHDATGDAARTLFLNGEGYRVIRFWNNDVLQNIEGVIAKIADVLTEPAQ